MKNLMKLIFAGLTAVTIASAQSQFFVEEEKIKFYSSYSEYVSFNLKEEKIKLASSEYLPDYVSMVDPNSKMVQNIITDIDTIGKSNIECAKTVYDKLRKEGLEYEPDKKQMRGNIDDVLVCLPDQIKYPDQTLKEKRGDCEDLSILYASCLLALDIPCALYYLPGSISKKTSGHMLNVIQLTSEDMKHVPSNNYLLIYDYQDNKWLPVDLSGIAENDFNNAYARGLLNIVNNFDPINFDEIRLLIPAEYQELFKYEKESF